jgi:ribosomal protein S6--L-glutamate ligase
MKIVLLSTVGTNFKIERVVREAAALGHECTATSIGEIDLQIKNNELILPGVTDLSADVVILHSVFTSVKNVISLVKHFRKKGIRIFDNNYSEIYYSINKVADLTKLSLENFPLPDSFHTRSYDEYPTLCAEIGYPVIIKPTKTGKGRGIEKLEDPKQLEAFVEKAKSEGRKADYYLLQEFIPYEKDLRILIIGDHVYAMRRFPQEGDFRANFSLGGTVEIITPDEETIKLSKRALHCIGLSIGGVDVLITPQGKRYILEVNHNPGIEGIESATGENIARTYLEHALKSAK